MILLCEPPDFPETIPDPVTRLYAAHAAAMRAVCPADFWCQKNGQGEIVAWLFRRENTVFVSLSAQPVSQELTAFLHTLGGRLCCRAEDARCLGFSPGRVLTVWKRQGTGEDSLPPVPRGEPLYHLLSAAFPMPPFSVWYPDFSHALRHGISRVYLAGRQENPDACVLALCVRENEALLGGVTTREDLRGRGVAKTLLEQTANRLGARTLFLLSEPELSPFYQQSGFLPAGEWSETEIDL